MGGLDVLDLVLFISATFAASFVAGFAFGTVASLHFLIGGAIGVPIGAELLRWTSPAALRVAIGIILVLFSAYSLWRPKLDSAGSAGPLADGGIGIVNGVIGGATGLAGIAATVWCSVRGWQAAEQRAVFQPFGVSVFVMAALWFGSTGTLGADTLGLFLIGLPALAAGTWAGSSHSVDSTRADFGEWF